MPVSAGDGQNDGGAGAVIGVAPRPVTPAGHDPADVPAGFRPGRRGFFAAAGLTALLAAAAATGGRAIAAARNTTAPSGPR